MKLKYIIAINILAGFIIIILYNQNKGIEGFEEGKLISVNDTELFVKVKGKGDPIILIHGGPLLEHGYLEEGLKFLESSNTVIYYDQRLSGRSAGKVDSTKISMEEMVDDIEGIKEYFQLDKIHLLGHSWGGLIAAEYAIEHSKNLKSLILLNAMAPSHRIWKEEETILSEKMTAYDQEQRRAILDSSYFKTNPTRAIEDLLRLSFKKQLADSSLVNKLKFYIPKDYFERSRQFGVLQDYLKDYDITEGIRKIEVPTLIIYGDHEYAATSSGKVYQEQIGNSEMIIVANSGHFPFLENGGNFKRLLGDFLNKQ